MNNYLYDYLPPNASGTYEAYKLCETRNKNPLKYHLTTQADSTFKFSMEHDYAHVVFHPKFDCYIVDHIEVAEGMRGNGIATTMLKYLPSFTDHPIYVFVRPAYKALLERAGAEHLSTLKIK